MAVMLQCPDCEKKFRWQFSEESRWPSHCPECGSYMGIDRADDDIVMPFLRSAKTTANDKLYRDMEAGSERRAEMAAEMAGVPVSEMSDLKITNLNDRRDAEVAAMPVQNSVTQHMETMNQRGAQFGYQAGGSEWAAGTAQGAVTVNGKTVTGIAPRAGASAVAKIQRLNGMG